MAGNRARGGSEATAPRPAGRDREEDKLRNADAEVLVCRVGRMSYKSAWSWQQDLRRDRLEGEGADLLLLVEHPPTYTLGRSSRPEHLLADAATLEREGIALYHIERGGSATYHGPGQLVGYPIVNLRNRDRDVHRFIRNLEQVLIGALATFGVEAGTREGLTGVWVEEKKIASIGIHVRQWITMHGFALNVAPDLRHFSWIQPCGFDSGVMTSMAEWMAEAPVLEAVAVEVTRQFEEVFECSTREVGVEELKRVAETAG